MTYLIITCILFIKQQKIIQNLVHKKKLIIFNPSIENGGVEKNLFLIKII